jgi:uncharacterized protein (DUF58 family)
VATRHETIAVAVLDPRELALPDVGVLSLVDPASGRTRDVHTSKKLRDRYATAATQQRAAIEQGIRQAGADHLILRTDQDWLLDIVRFVASRRERVHARRAGWESR